MNDDLSSLISSLEKQQKANFDSKIANLNTQRDIAHDKYANEANSAGLLFSNYAPTQQIKYDAQSYAPAVAKVQSNYLSTMDKIIAQGQKYKTQMDKLSQTIMEANSDK